MYQDEIFEKALQEGNEKRLEEVKHDVKTVEMLINKLLTQLLECSASVSERDFNACAL